MFMRELKKIENELVSGGDHTIAGHSQYNNDRNMVRELVVDSSLIAGPMIGANLGMLAATASVDTLLYGIGGCVLGAYAGIVAVPILTKIGLEMAFGVHDLLV
jgi:hypothetical protein